MFRGSYLPFSRHVMHEKESEHSLKVLAKKKSKG